MVSSEASKVILVSGANRGIGYGIVRRLAAEYSNSHLYAQSSLPLKIYLTSRDEKKGREAIDAIKAELKPDALKLTSIEYHQLDLSDANSKSTIVKFLQTKEGGLDAL
jgi:carbonyl reductase 1